METDSGQKSDQYWIDAALKEPDAFVELVRRYQDRIYSFALRMTGSSEDAQDIAQETMLRAYKALSTFRHGAPFAPWIYKIVTNLSINLLKRRNTHRSMVAQVMREQRPSDGVEALVEQRDAQKLVQQAVMELPSQYRAAILLRHFYQLSYEDIARTLEIPVGTAKTRIFRGRKILLSKLEKNGILGGHGLRESKATPSSLS